MQCYQCKNQAIYMVGTEGNEIPLCLHCSTKIKQADTDRLKTLSNMIGHFDQTLAFQAGFAPLPKFRAINTGEITLNNINVSHSKIGVINTGKIQAEAIDISISTLNENGHKELADALKALTEAVIETQQINEINKSEIIEFISCIAEESVKPREHRKKKLISSVLEKIGPLLTVAEITSKLWETAHPLIRHFFL